MSFYRHLKLDGDLAPAMKPAGTPNHFTADKYTLAPFYVADPAAVGGEMAPTSPYHIYVRRHEPQIVFGSIDTGVANSTRDDRLTFLDVVWNDAPFANHRQFVGTVTRVATEWVNAGRFNAQQQSAVVQAAGKAEAELRTT